MLANGYFLLPHQHFLAQSKRVLPKLVAVVGHWRAVECLDTSVELPSHLQREEEPTFLKVGEHHGGCICQHGVMNVDQAPHDMACGVPCQTCDSYR